MRQWRAPLGSSTDSTRQTPKACKKPLSQFIIAPRAQASRRCETQATLGGKPSSFSYRCGPLTPSARSANLIAGDGTKNGLSAPNKEPGTNQNDYLTEKAPYKSGGLSAAKRRSGSRSDKYRTDSPGDPRGYSLTRVVSV